MTTITLAFDRRHADRDRAWLPVAALGFAALLLASAMLDRRNGFVSADDVALAEEQTQPASLTTEELIHEMLTHD